MVTPPPTVASYDERTAREYCSANLAEALTLDKDIFEKYARAVCEIKPLDFVTFKEKPSGTIATDLSEYLSHFSPENADLPPDFAPGDIVEQSV